MMSAPAVAFTSAIFPPFEPHDEIGDTRAGGVKRKGRADDVLGATPVRSREDLLGREVRDVLDTGLGLANLSRIGSTDERGVKRRE